MIIQQPQNSEYMWCRYLCKEKYGRNAEKCLFLESTTYWRWCLFNRSSHAELSLQFPSSKIFRISAGGFNPNFSALLQRSKREIPVQGPYVASMSKSFSFSSMSVSHQEGVNVSRPEAWLPLRIIFGFTFFLMGWTLFSLSPSPTNFGIVLKFSVGTPAATITSKIRQ